MVDASLSTASPRFSRRALARGVAWTTPALVASTAAPAFAVSHECMPLTKDQATTALAFTGSTLGQWAQKSTTDPSGRTAPRVLPGSANLGTSPYWQFWNQSNTAAVVDDPPTNIGASIVLTSTAVCLDRGTYTFSFSAKVYSRNSRELVLKARVFDAQSSATLGSASDMKSKDGTGDARSRTITMTLTQRTQVRMEYTWTFTKASGTTGDDIGVTGPTVQKTA